MASGPRHSVLHRAKWNNNTLWTATAGCAIAQDTSIYASVGDETASLATLKVTPTAGQTLLRVTLTADLNPVVNLTTATHMRLRYYIPPNSGTWTDLTLGIVLYSSADKLQYRQYNQSIYSTRWWTPGWHTVIWPKAFFSNESGFVETNLLSYRLQIYNGTIPVVPIYVDELAFVTLAELAKPLVALNVDDCNTGADGTGGGKALLAAVLARGLTATAYVIPSAVGRTGFTIPDSTPASFMTLADLHEMQDRGIVIGNHGYYSYKYFTHSMTPASFRQEYDRAAEWMIRNGLGRGAYYIALPGGEADRAALDALRGYAQVRFVAEPYSAGASSRADLTDEDNAVNFPAWIDPYTPACSVTGLGDATAANVYAAVKTAKGVFIGLEHAWGAGIGTFLDTVATDVAAGTVEIITMDQLAPALLGAGPLTAPQSHWIDGRAVDVLRRYA